MDVAFDGRSAHLRIVDVPGTDKETSHSRATGRLLFRAEIADVELRAVDAGTDRYAIMMGDCPQAVLTLDDVPDPLSFVKTPEVRRQTAATAIPQIGFIISAFVDHLPGLVAAPDSPCNWELRALAEHILKGDLSFFLHTDSAERYCVEVAAKPEYRELLRQSLATSPSSKGAGYRQK